MRYICLFVIHINYKYKYIKLYTANYIIIQSKDHTLIVYMCICTYPSVCCVHSHIPTPHPWPCSPLSFLNKSALTPLSLCIYRFSPLHLSPNLWHFLSLLPSPPIFLSLCLILQIWFCTERICIWYIDLLYILELRRAKLSQIINPSGILVQWLFYSFIPLSTPGSNYKFIVYSNFVFVIKKYLLSIQIWALV